MTLKRSRPEITVDVRSGFTFLALNKAAQKLFSVWNSKQVAIDRPSESKKARSDINSDFCESNHEIDNNVADGDVNEYIKVTVHCN